MNREVLASSEKFLQCAEKRRGMTAFYDEAIHKLQHVLGKLHVGGEKKNFYVGINPLERHRDLVAIHFRHRIIEDDG